MSERRQGESEVTAAHIDPANEQRHPEFHDARVVVLSDQPMERQALAALLCIRAGADVQCVASVIEARKLIRGDRPTLMLWSARDVGRDDVEAMVALRDAVALGLVMLVDRISCGALSDLLAGRAQSLAVLRRDTAPTLEDTVRALDEVHRGRLSLDAEVLGVVLGHSSELDGMNDLTGAEREVAELVAGGLRNVSIGKRLCKSERTVEKQVSNVFDKLGLCAGLHPDLDRRVAATRIVLADTAGEALAVETLELREERP